MIGIVAKESEQPVLKEFFELFKTPWEFCQKDKDYEVIILSRDESIDSFKAGLMIIFSAGTTRFDKDHEILVKTDRNTQNLIVNRLYLPIYTGLSSFQNVVEGDTVVRQNLDVFGFKIQLNQRTILRIGYDFFEEISYLLNEGQPVKHATIPALDIHIQLLKTWILEAGVPVVEIPPAPEGHDFIVCLTHDADFIRIRDHFFDHTMGGFLYRALFGSLISFLRGRIPLSRVLRNWKAALSLPFIFLGKAYDFWFQFDRYAEIEKGETSTFFLIPFKKRRGDKVRSAKRATKYDIMDMRKTAEQLIQMGHEIGVHGIDAWHSQEKGNQERRRICEATCHDKVGIRMHWLLFDHQTFSVLEMAGYHYDSTLGYSDAVGYRNGTAQVFRPRGATHLLELPLHIQDTALFYPGRMNLSEKQAISLCDLFIQNALRYGGVLTINWHQRSLAPERLWGDFYLHLLEKLRACRPWFATARQVVDWYQKRREASFDDVQHQGDKPRLTIQVGEMGSLPRLLLRINRPRNQASRLFKTRSSSGSADDYMDIPIERSFEVDLVHLKAHFLGESS